MATKLTRVGDLTVAVERPPPASRSTKPPVLLIHGMFAGAWMWDNYQSLLARHGYDSHAINLRGHHGSRAVADIGKVSVRDYVADAREVARTLRSPIIIGHSMGGLVAQKIAEAGNVRALVLIGSAPPRWIPVASWRLIRRQLRYLPELFLHKPIRPSRGDADDLMFNRTPVADREKFFPLFVPESGKAGFELSFGIIGVSQWRVTAPVLVVTGKDDHFVVPRVARSLARKYKASLREYDNFAHHIITEPGWERPCADVIQWLNGVAGESGAAGARA